MGRLVQILQLQASLLAEVFGEKPDAVLDVGHGSHRTAHEAKQKLATARTRIEVILAEMTRTV